MPYTAQEVDDALTALIAYNGNASAAIRYLKQEGKRAPTFTVLREWARIRHWERYEQLRETLAQKREDQLANDFLDAATKATEGAQLGVEKALEKLRRGKDDDPGRTAAHLSRVAQSFTEKRLTLQGRPTRISETRDVEATVRKLMAMGIIELPDGEETPAQIEAGDG